MIGDRKRTVCARVGLARVVESWNALRRSPAARVASESWAVEIRDNLDEIGEAVTDARAALEAIRAEFVDDDSPVGALLCEALEALDGVRR